MSAAPDSPQDQRPDQQPDRQSDQQPDLEQQVQSLDVENRRITEELQRLQSECAELVVVREQQRVELGEQREAVRELTGRLRAAESRARRAENSRAYRAAKAVRRLLRRPAD